MRPSTLHDALLRSESLARELNRDRSQRRREPATPRADNPNYKRNNPPNHFQPRPRVYATTGQGRSLANVQCYECNELGHYRSDCPHRGNHVAVAQGGFYHEPSEKQ